MSRWFRLYDDLVDDPKVQRLGPDLFKALINLWCLASKNDGVLPSTNEIAFKLRIRTDRVIRVINELKACGLLDEAEGGGFTPHNWNGRQYKSDVSNERVKRYRDRKRNAECNVTETPPETETETETEKKEDGAERSASENVVPIAGYAFNGNIIRVKHDQFERWRRSYPDIPDITAALETADAYYSEKPPKDGRWFFAASSWLQRENSKARNDKKREEYGTKWW